MVNTFTSILNEMIGPSIISVKEKAKVMSRMPRSLEKVLISLPEGLVSK